MTAKKLDGLAAADALAKELRQRCEKLQARGVIPGLATVLVGDDPASHSYVSGKHADCQKIGIRSIRVELAANISQKELLTTIESLNQRKDVSGIIVQLPLPANLDEAQALIAISPTKDADGLHPINLGHLVQGRGLSPCTPAGIVRLLEHHGITWEGKTVVVIGRGLTVGRPLSLLLSGPKVNATVILTHSRTRNIIDLSRSADVVVACAGSAHLVRPDWVKPGAVVVDVGINRIGVAKSGKAILAGDVHPAVSEIASYLSPVPGGVGPMTRMMLLSNLLSLAEENSP